MSKQNKMVKIGFVPYHIERVDELFRDLGRYADIEHLRQLIRIDAECQAEFEVSTLLHEVTHGWLEQARIEDQDEQMIDVCVHGFIEFMREESNTWMAAGVIGISEEALLVAREFDNKKKEKGDLHKNKDKRREKIG